MRKLARKLVDTKDIQSLPDMSYVPGVRSVSIIARLSLASQSSSFVPFLSGTPQYQHTYMYNTQYLGTHIHTQYTGIHTHTYTHSTRKHIIQYTEMHTTHTHIFTMKVRSWQANIYLKPRLGK